MIKSKDYLKAMQSSRRGDADDDDDDDDFELGQKSAPNVFRVFATEKVIRAYEIYLSHPVVAPHAYDDLCQILRATKAEDTVRIFVNSPGGDVAAGLALIQAMREAPATVTTVLATEGLSMGALIFLAGDKKVVTPSSMLMIHNYSSGLVGKGNEQIAQVNALNAWIEGSLKDICSPFLSKAEIKAVMQGQDIWLSSEAIKKRLAAMGELAPEPEAAPTAG